MSCDQDYDVNDVMGVVDRSISVGCVSVQGSSDVGGMNSSCA